MILIFFVFHGVSFYSYKKEVPRSASDKYTKQEKEKIDTILKSLVNRDKDCANLYVRAYTTNVVMRCMNRSIEDMSSGKCAKIADSSIHTEVIVRALLNCNINWKTYKLK